MMVRIPVEPVAAPTCIACGSSDLKDDGKPKEPLVVADTPIWGKPTQLVQARPRQRCKRCGGLAYKRSASFHAKRNLTNRLIRHVETEVTKRTISDVAREMALSPKQVTTLATDFLARLEKMHRFPQPDVVAMDGIKCNDRRFQIISDGRTGHTLAIAESWEADRAWNALRDAIDVTKVRVFVTDMHLSNLSVAGTLHDKTERASVHVADKFHVIHACNQAVSRVINDQVQDLRGKSKAGDANELLALKAKIEGKRTTAEKQSQTEFDFDLPPAIDNYPKVQIAHRARRQLWRMYRSVDRETARRQLVEFERLASDPLIAARFEKVLTYIVGHAEQVLNYFDVLERRHNGELRGFDTAKAERRNSDIKKLWRDARGEGMKLFKLRALYHPYRFGAHILEHSCGHFEGPLAHMEVLSHAHLPIGMTADSICPVCR